MRLRQEHTTPIDLATATEFVRFVVRRDLKTMAESEDVLWSIAAINTDAKAPEPSREQMPNGKEALAFDRSMGAAYAWRYVMTHSAAICGLPRRDFGFVTTDNTPESLAMLGVATLKHFREAEDHPAGVPLRERQAGRRRRSGRGAEIGRPLTSALLGVRVQTQLELRFGARIAPLPARQGRSVSSPARVAAGQITGGLKSRREVRHCIATTTSVTLDVFKTLEGESNAEHIERRQEERM